MSLEELDEKAYQCISRKQKAKSIQVKKDNAEKEVFWIRKYEKFPTQKKESPRTTFYKNEHA